MRPILDAWHNRLLRDIRPGHIRDLANKLYPDGSAATRNRQGIVPAVAVINHAADRGHCQPIRVRRYKVHKKADRAAVDRDWIAAFREHASSDYIAALALFMFQTGARLGEAVSLTPDSLDLANRQARLARTKNGEPHSYQLTTGMARELAELPPRNGHVFGYRSRHSVYTAWRNTCARAGIAYVPPHQAGRHSFATEMIVRHGADVVTTARMGNWKSIRLLLETYAHAENLRSVAEEVFGDQLPDVPAVARADLYVLETAGFYKIGRSRDVESRRRDLQVGCPTPVRIVLARSYDMALVITLEMAIHDLLRAHRGNGEWFKCSLSTIRRAIRQAERLARQDHVVVPISHRLPSGAGRSD